MLTLMFLNYSLRQVSYHNYFVSRLSGNDICLSRIACEEDGDTDGTTTDDQSRGLIRIFL